MRLAWPFSETPAFSLAHVGGKAFSLIRMAQAGLAVPPGFALSVQFFQPWFAALERIDAPHGKPMDTDPGWTPLFVNAAAVVLEVAGLLQHGALVAHEYGKPCVAGVESATQPLVDGTEVEVDGVAGVVRLLSSDVA